MLFPAAKKAASIPRRRTWETITGRGWSQTIATVRVRSRAAARGCRSTSIAVAMLGSLALSAFEPRPSPPENDGEEHQEAGEHHDSLAVAPDEVLQRGGVLAERLEDLLPDLLHLRRAREQLPERDALHLEELLGLERLRLRHAGQRVGDAHPDRGHLGLRGQQLAELSLRLCGRRIDGGAQRGDALQDRSGGAILAGPGPR